MVQRALSVVFEHGPGGANLHVNYCEVVAHTIVNLTSQTIAFFCFCEFFDFCCVIPEPLISSCKFGASLTLACRHPCKDHDENYAGAIDKSNRDSINPPTAQE